MNKDQLTNMDVGSASRASMQVIDALQRMTPAEQVAGIASCFLLLCAHLSITPQEAFAATTNLMHYAEGRRPEFLAVEQYMREEL